MEKYTIIGKPTIVTGSHEYLENIGRLFKGPKVDLFLHITFHGSEALSTIRRKEHILISKYVVISLII